MANRRGSIKKSFFAVLAVSLVAACSTVSKVDPQGASLAARPEGCQVTVIQGEHQPIADAQVLGEIETHVQGNLFFGGAVDVDDAISELRKKTCALGGNAVRIDEVIESSAAESTHVHVWATALVLSPGSK